MGRATLAHEMVGWQYHHDRDLTGSRTAARTRPSWRRPRSRSCRRAARRGCVHPAAPAMGARCDRLGSPAGRVAGGDHRSPEVGQPGAGPTTADLPRHAHRSGSVRQDLPAERGVRDHVQHGTIFVGFCGSQGPLAQMLESMVGNESEPPDQLTSVARRSPAPTTSSRRRTGWRRSGRTTACNRIVAIARYPVAPCRATRTSPTRSMSTRSSCCAVRPTRRTCRRTSSMPSRPGISRTGPSCGGRA